MYVCVNDGASRAWYCVAFNLFHMLLGVAVKADHTGWNCMHRSVAFCLEPWVLDYPGSLNSWFLLSIGHDNNSLSSSMRNR